MKIMKKVLCLIGMGFVASTAHAASFHEICHLPAVTDYPVGAEMDFVVTSADAVETEIPYAAKATFYSLALSNHGRTISTRANDNGIFLLKGNVVRYHGDSSATIFTQTASTDKTITQAHLVNQSHALTTITVGGVTYTSICDRQ